MLLINEQRRKHERRVTREFRLLDRRVNTERRKLDAVKSKSHDAKFRLLVAVLLSVASYVTLSSYLVIK